MILLFSFMCIWFDCGGFVDYCALIQFVCLVLVIWIDRVGLVFSWLRFNCACLWLVCLWLVACAGFMFRLCGL